jgi:hypothetical protein
MPSSSRRWSARIRRTTNGRWHVAICFNGKPMFYDPDKETGEWPSRRSPGWTTWKKALDCGLSLVHAHQEDDKKRGLA